MADYSVSIVESSKELTGKERVALKNLDDCVSLDDAITPDTPKVVIDVKDYVILNVHNEKSDSKDYEKYIIYDKSGTRYITGSHPFFTTFEEIFSEMKDDDEEWSLVVYKRESNNYKGKQFLTCTII